MLLLVLIFVLAAFGLLLVALVTGTAAWAWISVVVSVAAAGILVADWAKRRAAVRTSAVGEPSAGRPPGVPMHIEESPTTAIPVPVSEPATEVFPALRQSYDARSSVANDDRTTAIPTPSGSSGRPSGAQSDVIRSGDPQSPRVTSGSNVGGEAGSPNSSAQSEGPSGAQQAGIVAAGVAAAAAAAKAKGARIDGSSGRGQSDDHAPRSGESPEHGSRPGDDYAQWQPRTADAAAERNAAERPDPAKQDGAEQRNSVPDSAEPDARKQDAADQGAARPDTSAPDPVRTAADDTPSGRGFVPDPQAGDRPGQQPGSPVPPPPVGAEPAAAKNQTGPDRSSPGRDANRTAAISAAAVAGAGAAGLAAASTAKKEQGKEQNETPPLISESDPTTAIPVLGGAKRADRQPGDTSLDRAEATQAITPVKGGPPVEPGEEKPDAAELATVSTLGDEVLVVDEHPRFHLAGCRVLGGSETIPLPAKEAIEYGFSPCSVCSPVRVLASRNRASSSS